MSRREDDSNGILDKILAWFAALFLALKQGVSSATQYYRNLLANYGYDTSAYV